MTEENKKTIEETIAKLKELKIESKKIEKDIETKIAEKDETKFEETRTKFSSMTVRFFKKAESKIAFVAKDVAKDTKTMFSNKDIKPEDIDMSKIVVLVEESNKKMNEVNSKVGTDEFAKDPMSVLFEAQEVTVFIESQIDKLQSIINHAD